MRSVTVCPLNALRSSQACVHPPGASGIWRVTSFVPFEISTMRLSVGAPLTTR